MEELKRVIQDILDWLKNALPMIKEFLAAFEGKNNWENPDYYPNSSDFRE